MEIPGSGDYFVTLATPRCQWKKGSILEYVSKARVFYDLFHRSITLFTGSPVNLCWSSDRNTGVWTDFPVNLPAANDILGAQLSPDKAFLAIRVSEVEVKILSTTTGELITARAVKAGSKMISVHWIDTEIPAPANSSRPQAGSGGEYSLLFVTSAGIEYYSFQFQQLRHLKTISLSLIFHWIFLEESFLLAFDGKGIFHGFKIKNKMLNKVARFELDCANTSFNNAAASAAAPGAPPFQREQLNIVSLYGRIYVAFINERKGALHFLSLNASEEMEQTHLLELPGPGCYSLSVLDNVLLVHSNTSKTSTMFDIKSEARTALLAPLAIGPPPPPFPAIPGFQAYAKWTFLLPHFVWESTGDQQQGNFWHLAINLQAIERIWPPGKRAKLFDFLLKRRSPEVKPLILELLKRLIVEQAANPSGSLTLASRLFAMLNRIVFDHWQQQETQNAKASGVSSSSLSSSFLHHSPASENIYNIHHYLLITQRDMLASVFSPLRSLLPGETLFPYVIEYIRSISRAFLRLDEEFNEFLVEFFLSLKKYHEFQQFLQYQIINDSLKVAEWIFDASQVYLPFYQIAIDMFYRLNAFPRLISILLARGEVLKALQMIPSPRSPIFDTLGLQPKIFLSAALNGGDRILFYTVYKYFEARNFLLRYSNSFLPNEECASYTEYFYREYYQNEREEENGWNLFQGFLRKFAIGNAGAAGPGEESETTENPLELWAEEVECDDPEWRRHVAVGKSAWERKKELERAMEGAASPKAVEGGENRFELGSPVKSPGRELSGDSVDSSETLEKAEQFVDSSDDEEDSEAGLGLSVATTEITKSDSANAQEESLTSEPTFEFSA